MFVGVGAGVGGGVFVGNGVGVGRGGVGLGVASNHSRVAMIEGPSGVGGNAVGIA